MQTREHNLKLVQARRVKNAKVELTFMQHCPNPHKKGASSSARSQILQSMNAGDPKFDQSKGGSGNYYFRANGTQAEVAKAWGIDLSALGTNDRDILELNIDNPAFIDANGNKQDVCLQVTEILAPQMRQFYSEAQANKIARDIQDANLSTDFKRKGAEGAYILSGGHKIWVDTDIAFGAVSTHRFLPMDTQATGLGAVAPVAQQQAPVTPPVQAPPVQTPVQTSAEAGDLPF